VGSPNIEGDNGGFVTVTDVTTNQSNASLEFWYTLDGSDPTNSLPSLGPISLTASNAAYFSFIVTSNTTFKVQGYLNVLCRAAFPNKSSRP